MDSNVVESTNSSLNESVEVKMNGDHVMENQTTTDSKADHCENSMERIAAQDDTENAATTMKRTLLENGQNEEVHLPAKENETSPDSSEAAATSEHDEGISAASLDNHVEDATNYNEEAANHVEDASNDNQQATNHVEETSYDNQQAASHVKDTCNDNQQATNHVEDAPNDNQQATNHVENTSNDNQQATNHVEETSNDNKQATNPVKDKYNDNQQVTNHLEETSNDNKQGTNHVEGTSNDNKQATNHVEDTFNDNKQATNHVEDASNDNQLVSNPVKKLPKSQEILHTKDRQKVISTSTKVPETPLQKLDVVSNQQSARSVEPREKPMNGYVNSTNATNELVPKQNGSVSKADDESGQEDTLPSEDNSKLSLIKSRLSNAGVTNLDVSSGGESTGNSSRSNSIKRQTRVFYAGLQSAKSKFIEEANKSTQSPVKGNKQPKRITPPRDGLTTSVVESQPQARDPNIVWYGDDPEGGTEWVKQIQTKSILAKFKDIQAGKATDDSQVSADKPRPIDEIDSSGAKSALAKWKYIEVQKEDPSAPSENRKFELLKDETRGGIYENQPEELEGVIKASSGTVRDNENIQVSAKEIRNQFLRNASDAQQFGNIKKVDPVTEIQELSRRERTTIFENAPKSRPEGVIASDDPFYENGIQLTTCNAKELREKFSNPEAFQVSTTEKKPVELSIGEGGIFENEPVRLDNVIRYEDVAELSVEEQKAKWASQAKQKFIEEAQKVTQPQEKKPLDLGLHSNLNGNSGIYENTPQPSKADVSGQRGSDHTISNGDDQNGYEDPGLAAARSGSGVRQRYLEMQKALEEQDKQKKRPEMINIWDELCEHSGVFENIPSQRPKDIVTSNQEDENDLESVATQ